MGARNDPPNTSLQWREARTPAPLLAEEGCGGVGVQGLISVCFIGCFPSVIGDRGLRGKGVQSSAWSPWFGVPHCGLGQLLGRVAEGAWGS